MAKEIVTRCDVCGEVGDDVRTYAIRTDGQAWEVDLDVKHAETILKVARKGRELAAGAERGTKSSRSLEHRIRNRPDM